MNNLKDNIEGYNTNLYSVKSSDYLMYDDTPFPENTSIVYINLTKHIPECLTRRFIYKSERQEKTKHINLLVAPNIAYRTSKQIKMKSV